MLLLDTYYYGNPISIFSSNFCHINCSQVVLKPSEHQNYLGEHLKITQMIVPHFWRFFICLNWSPEIYILRNSPVIEIFTWVWKQPKSLLTTKQIWLYFLGNPLLSNTLVTWGDELFQTAVTQTFTILFPTKI